MEKTVFALFVSSTVVFTTPAVLLALARCCFAAGGDHATAVEDPTAYLTILINKSLPCNVNHLW